LIGEPKIYYKVREIQTVTNPSLEGVKHIVNKKNSYKDHSQ
jgi:hypothetical protein